MSFIWYVFQRYGVGIAKIINGIVYSSLDLFAVGNLLNLVVLSSLLWPFIGESVGVSLICIK